MTQSNLGHALRLLGEQLNDDVLLQQAIGACRAALEIYTLEAAPRDWAMTSTNLANALAAHGDLEEAITVYRSVLDSAQRSVARFNLALAQRRLRERAGVGTTPSAPLTSTTPPAALAPPPRP